MKKGKILVVVLIGLLLAGGLVMFGCDIGCSQNKECVYEPTVETIPGSGKRVTCSTSECDAVQKAARGQPGSCSCPL